MRFICIYKLYAKVKTLFQIKLKFQLLLDLTWRVCSNYCKFHGLYIMWTQDTLRPCQLKQALCENNLMFVITVDLNECLAQIKAPIVERARLFLSYHLLKVPRLLKHYSLMVYMIMYTSFMPKTEFKTVFKIKIKFQFQKSILLDLTHSTYIRW